MVIGNGSVANADEILEITKIQEVYSGNAFDSSAVNTTDEQSYELTAVGATVNTNYVKVTISGRGTVGADNNSSGTVSLKAQIKEIGQSYADINAYRIVIYKHEQENGDNGSSRGGVNFPIWYELTSGMKTNGFQVAVYSECIGSGSEGSASFINWDTVLELKA